MDRKTGIALCIALSAAMSCGGGREKYSWDKDLEHRIETDFCRSREEVTDYVRKYIPEVTGEQIDAWTADGRLESMVIGGETRYFRNAAPNLFRLDPECRAIKESVDGPEDSRAYRTGVRNMAKVREKDGGNCIGQPRRMRVRYTLTVDAGAVPDGKKIRCWLPWPRTDVPRQTDVKFIEAGWTSRPADCGDPMYFRTELPDAEELVFSGNDSRHSTLYMEAKASAGWPTVFYEEFEYVSSAECHDLDSLVAAAEKAAAQERYNAYSGTGLNPEFHADERDVHIRFSPEILALRDSLSAGISNPVLKAKAFYDWIDANFPWASAREYSTIENIPEYVLDSGHGDCGQVSLLFITLCRSAGIPAHFQSGFMMHPGAWNLHDWAEIWADGTGWIPVDQSFGSDEYFGNIDSYRMIVNSDFGQALIPAKKYPRSETVDFQRGEVEWDGGNLYFDNWSYDMEIEYLK